MVVGEGALGDVAVQVGRGNVDLRALDRPLEQAPEVLYAVGMDIAGDVLAAGVVDLLDGEVFL